MLRYLPIPGVIIGSVLYCLLYQAVMSALLLSYNLEHLESSDHVFTIDEEKQICNLVGCFYFERFEFEEMQRFLL